MLFFILNWFIKKPRPLGAVSGLIFSWIRHIPFLVEFVREPDAQLGLFGGYISMGESSSPMIILGILMMVWAYKRGFWPRQSPSRNEVRNW